MKVKRIVDGRTYEFELTQEEIDEVYFEESRKAEFDLIEENLHDQADEDDLIQNIPVDDLVSNSKFMEQLAARWRKYNGNGGDPSYNFDEAVEITIERLKAGEW